MKSQPLNGHSAALAADVRVIGMQQGDSHALSISAPDGSVFSEYAPPARKQQGAVFHFLREKPERRNATAWSKGPTRRPTA